MPDNPFAEAKATKPAEHESALTWVDHNVLNPALNAGPLGIYNTVAEFTGMDKAHLTVDKATPYSTEWYTQNLSSGVGAAAPFLLASYGVGKLMGAADGALAGTSAGDALSPLLKSKQAATILGGMSYSALQTPEQGHTRFGDAVGTGVAFGIFGAGNALVKDAGLAGRLASYPVIGLVGGTASAEASSLFSTGHFAGTDTALQSGVAGMTLNGVFGGVGELARNTDTAARTTDATKQTAEATPTLVKPWEIKYPNAAEYDRLTPEDHVNLGFYHPDAKNLESRVWLPNKERPLPPAGQVASEVTKSMADVPLAGKDGDLAIGEWNMEFLTGDKARYFSDTYKQVVPRHHLMFVEETNEDGIAQIAKDNGYSYAVSRANSRGQAVGFLVNPRLKVLNQTAYEDVANVFNIPDERPALRLDLLDTTTGNKFSVTGVHLKSMMGGPEKTAPVRAEQSRLLANDLGSSYSGMVGGDWNAFLDKVTDFDPLKKAGFKLFDPGDDTSTQAMGGRIDGFFTKNLPGQLTDYKVRPFFQNPLITRGLSDHGLLTTHLHFNNNPTEWNGAMNVNTSFPMYRGYD